MPSIMAMASISTPSRNLIDQQTVNVADAFALSNGKLKPHSTPATLCWLEKNYELSEGVCIPRNVVYYNYTDFCRKNNMLPVNAASFGKVTARASNRVIFFWIRVRRISGPKLTGPGPSPGPET